MSEPQQRPFDFDAWRELAASDPEAFERERQAVLTHAIERAPAASRSRLRALQWRIDMERRRYRDPLVGCQRLFTMMWEAVYHQGAIATTGGRDPQRQARILPFRRPARPSMHRQP